VSSGAEAGQRRKQVAVAMQAGIDVTTYFSVSRKTIYGQYAARRQAGFLQHRQQGGDGSDEGVVPTVLFDGEGKGKDILSIDWAHFTPGTSLAGGILIGISASLFELLQASPPAPWQKVTHDPL
jgi:hypothetical protein